MKKTNTKSYMHSYARNNNNNHTKYFRRKTKHKKLYEVNNNYSTVETSTSSKSSQSSYDDNENKGTQNTLIIKNNTPVHIIENTVVLVLKVKITLNYTAVFKVRKFDDLYVTAKIFCDIHNLGDHMVKPLIIKALYAMNAVYKIYNSTLNNDNVDYLSYLKVENNKIHHSDNVNKDDKCG
jgi:hypothetical protein